MPHLVALALRTFAVLSALSLLACCFVPQAPADPSGTTAPIPPVPLPPLPPPSPDVAMTLRTIEVVLPPTKAIGLAWDVGGGAPDPFVVVSQAGRTLATTDRQQDSLGARWDVNVVFDRTQPLQIDVLDRDVANDDPVASQFFTFEPGATVEEGPLTDWGGTLRLELR
jgi:hypothetical protein